MNGRYSRRTLLRALVVAGATVGLADGSTADDYEASSKTDPHTRETFRALLGAIIPETPELAADLGEEHEAGAVTVGLDEFFVTFLNELVSAGLPGVGHVEDARLSEGLAAALDSAATELLARGDNEQPPAEEASTAGGPFARLSRRDRLRAITLFEEKEFDTTGVPGPFFEADGGLVAQLLVGFAPFVYYSEWAGYDDFTASRSEREFDPQAVVGWQQVGYPGNADGYAALRGYLQLDGDVDGVQLRMSPGEFRENEYDTADYEDPYPETSDEGDVPSGVAARTPAVGSEAEAAPGGETDD